MKIWVKKIKIALAEEDEADIIRLFEEAPFKNASYEELQQASSLIGEALNLMEKKKEDLAHNINKLKKAREFLQA
ncbi:hypothetical protein [Campylobacter troglodytis]|uniref:hypothetical protein n=1 Tax=Campylobacter troglodytis TaxID=654363 RepID=UPI001158C60C|nr:hypothetical protein [Campylobacter troglodytis]TQR60550.1 hypothetical protein DMC01_05255 [Campylobacter troglodytis]